MLYPFKTTEQAVRISGQRQTNCQKCLHKVKLNCRKYSPSAWGHAITFTQLYVDSCWNWKKCRCHVDNWTCYTIVYKLMKHSITPQTDEAMRPRQWITQFPGVSQNCTINIGGYWLKNLSGLINGKFSQSFTAFLFLVHGKGEISPLKFLVSR